MSLFFLIFFKVKFDLNFFLFKERIKEDNREAQNLKELLANRINDYVEEVLMPYFGNLICFVKECEIIIEKENFNALKAYESNYFCFKAGFVFLLKFERTNTFISKNYLLIELTLELLVSKFKKYFSFKIQLI